MSSKDFNLILDVQDGTTGKNRLILDYDEFAHDVYDNNKSDIELNTSLTLGEYLLFREVRRAIVDDKHDILIKIGYNN